MTVSRKKSAALIVALDVDTLGEVRTLLDQLEDSVEIFKVGSQLFTACGPAAVRFVQARGKRVFLDLKFHDIPNTVASAVTSAVGMAEAVERTVRKGQTPAAGGLMMLTVHTSGGAAMMTAAIEAAERAAKKLGTTRPRIVGVTVLTSEARGDDTRAMVLGRALLARQAGLDGVVASCEEAAMIRKELGKDFIIVTPGIRPQGSDSGDQQRIATPSGAVAQGSDFLVVGRPIVQAADPKAAARAIVQEMKT